MELSGSMQRKQKEGNKKGGKKEKTGIIILVYKQCLLIQFLDDTTFDNMSLINLLAATNYGIKSIGEVKVLL